MDFFQTKQTDYRSGVFLGTYPQDPWPYLVSLHPEAGLSYPGLAGFRQDNFDLGSSDTLPNFSFEVKGLCNDADLHGANPKTIIYDLLTNTQYGLGNKITPDLLGNWEPLFNFCKAFGLYISPTISSQTQAQELISRWLELANAQVFESEGKIKLVCLGDTAVSGNGASWSPDLTPKASLNYDHFLVDDKSDPPVIWTITTYADAYNQLELEYVNRLNDYNTEVIEAFISSDIDRRGTRPAGKQEYPEITDVSTASKVAQILLQKKFYDRLSVIFKLPWNYVYLEPGDIVEISDPDSQAYNVLVRITKIEENEDDDLTFSADVITQGVNFAIDYTLQTGERYNPADNDLNPGSVNDPIIFFPPTTLSGDKIQAWIAVSGPRSQNWGGANIYVSYDNVSYKLLGTVESPARHGTLSAVLPDSTANPDTTNTMGVDLSISGGQLISATQNDADNLRTLCYVGGEYIAFKDATLTGSNAYDLDYLVRGAYGSEIIEHPIGTPFCRLDDAIFKADISNNDLGKTIYIKFLSFNTLGVQYEGLADVEPYEYEIPGISGSLSAPLNLAVINNTSSPNDTLNITCNSITLQAATGSVIIVTNVSLSKQNTTLAANTWYYVYLISNATTYEKQAIITNEYPYPTLPSGFTHFRLVSAVKTDASGYLMRINQQNFEILYSGLIPIYDGTTSQDWADMDLSPLVPQMSIVANMSLRVTVLSSGDTNIGIKPKGSTSLLGQLSANIQAGMLGQVSGWGNTDENQIVQISAFTETDWILLVGGYRIN